MKLTGRVEVVTEQSIHATDAKCYSVYKNTILAASFDELSHDSAYAGLQEYIADMEEGYKKRGVLYTIDYIDLTK